MENLGSIQTMGIVNALKTGNVVLDTSLALALPIVIGLIVTTAQNLHKMMCEVNWMKLLFRKRHLHERFIKHSTITNTTYGNSTDLGGGDSQNEVLMKAIQLYLDNHGLLKLTTADLELQSVGEQEQRDSYYDYWYGGESKSTSVADTLSKYKVVKRPISGRWISLGKFDDNDDCSETTNEGKVNKQHEVKLMIKEDKEDVGGGENNQAVSHKCERTFHFQSKGKKSIDNFIDKAYNWYLNELKKLEDDSRYMYEIASNKTESSDGEVTNGTYKRYQLSEEKTFKSLFFQQKETILKVVNHFVKKTGKYAIEGYPHKLGLLLHGPPGTGKTSLIKALAQHTGRSIVNVSLARITTNAELASIFFDQKYQVEGESVPVKMGFKDVIFVMEDIDAVSKVVRRRDGKKTADVTYTEQVEMPIKKSLWTMILESTNDSCKELVEVLLKKSERLKTAAQSPEALHSAAKRLGTVPGLSLVGEEVENDTVRQIAKEAVESSQALMSDYNAVDEFIGTHASSLKQMIDAGAEINEAFENELLGLSADGITGTDSFITLPPPPSLSREVSIKQYGENDDAEIETSDMITGFGNVDLSDLLDESGGNSVGSEKGGKKGGKTFGGAGTSFFKKKDELNLSGILNVFDGVVDTPGRMLIITSNHPEQLDPALIRPGRIDKKLLLGYMAPVDLISMIEHYFQVSLNDKQKSRLEVAVNGGFSSSSKQHLKLTPAQVEQMACEFEEVEEMIKAVERKSSHIPKKASNMNKRIVYGT